METDRKKVAICSEDKTFSAALRLLLPEFDVEVVPGLGEAKDKDVLVYYKAGDGKLPRQDLYLAATSTPTLVMADPKFMIESVDAQCRGFLPTSSHLETVRDAVRTIADDGAVVPPDLLGHLLRHLVERRRRTYADSGLERLTERERQVFHLAANGARKDEIGETLFISPATARTHLQRVYRKLGVHSQAELVALAARSGEFENEEER